MYKKLKKCGLDKFALGYFSTSFAHSIAIYFKFCKIEWKGFLNINFQILPHNLNLDFD